MSPARIIIPRGRTYRIEEGDTVEFVTRVDRYSDGTLQLSKSFIEGRSPDGFDLCEFESRESSCKVRRGPGKEKRFIQFPDGTIAIPLKDSALSIFFRNLRRKIIN